MSYAEKVCKIAPEDREFLRKELDWLAKWIMERYPTMNYREINRFLHEMLDMSV